MSSYIRRHFTQRGFTLLETVLSIAIILILAGLSIPVFYSFQAKNNVDLASTMVAQSLRRAQALAEAVSGDATWGVKVATNTITIFQGTSFATRNISFDETLDFSQNLTVSGTSEFVFTKLYGFPQASGTLQLTSLQSNTRDTRILIVNEKGTVNY